MIKSYDFKSPKKFTKERMSTVENLYDGFSRSLATYLTGLLQAYCEVNIINIEEKRYQEYAGQIEDQSLFGIISLMPENKDYNEAPLILEIEPSLGFFMIERLLGGPGTEYELQRDFTDIEKAILEFILKKMTGLVDDAWNGYIEMQATLTGLETNPHLLQLSAPEDVSVIVQIEVNVNNLPTRMHLVMPASNVEELTSKFGYKFAVGTRKQDQEKSLVRRTSITQHLLDSEVELRAVLHDFELDAQDILELQAGDVIPLTKLINSDVELYVEDKNCFQARIGHTKLRKAVQISKIL